MNAFPTVEPYYDMVNGEKKVVIWLLQSLGDGIELTLVRTGVVCLTLSWY